VATKVVSVPAGAPLSAAESDDGARDAAVVAASVELVEQPAARTTTVTSNTIKVLVRMPAL
jgi:hypothetical protein